MHKETLLKNRLEKKVENLYQALTDEKKEKLKYVFLFFIVFFISLIVEPFEKGPIDLCMFKNLTNLPCPGCGLTRSFVYLAHGAIDDSVRVNPFGIIFFTGWAWVSLKDLIWILLRKKIPFLPQHAWTVSKTIFIFGLIAFGIIRILFHLNEFEFLHGLNKIVAIL